MPSKPCLLQEGAQNIDPPQDPHQIPWFGQLRGYTLVPAAGEIGGALKKPAALVTLSESSQMMVFDLGTMHPMPLALPFQELSTVSVSLLKGAGTGQHGDLHFVTLNRLRVSSTTVLACSPMVLTVYGC